MYTQSGTQSWLKPPNLSSITEPPSVGSYNIGFSRDRLSSRSRLVNDNWLIIGKEVQISH